MKNVLIVSRDSFTRHMLADLLTCRSGLLNVLNASSLKTALATSPSIQAVVIGPCVSETSCCRLMDLFPARFPDIRIFILSRKASPKLRARVKLAHPTVQIFRPQDVSLMIERMLSVLRIECGGRVSGISLASFLQMAELEGCTCELQISAADHTGYLGLLNGALVTAKVGDLHGTPAALQILGWSDASIEMNYTPPDRPQEITTPLLGLLLESKRLSDEKAAARSDQRAHQRFGCSQIVDYATGNQIGVCDLIDIGLGGACIRTHQPVTIGQKIIITLPVPDHRRGCTISGQVVHHRSRQTGLCFESATRQQEKAIRKLVADHCPLEQELEFSFTDPLPEEAFSRL